MRKPTFSRPLVAGRCWPACALALLLAGTAACTGTTTRRAASVVDYLYPERSDVVVTPAVPELRLPLRVGIAFVPEVVGGAPADPATALPEPERMALLDEVAEHFRKQPFVRSIEVIPSAHLVPQGGSAIWIRSSGCSTSTWSRWSRTTRCSSPTPAGAR